MEKRRSWVLGTGIVLGLGLVVYAGAHPVPWVWSPPTWDIEPVPPPTLIAPEEPSGFDALPETSPSPIWAWVFTGLGVLAALAILFFVVRLIVRAIRGIVSTHIEDVPDVDSLGTGASLKGAGLNRHEVVDVVEEALRRLDQAPTPTDAVILAWLAFEEAATRHGMGRDPAQTPTEFTALILDRSPVPPSDATTLRTLYSQARFSTIPTAPADVGQARGALEHIARSLEQT